MSRAQRAETAWFGGYFWITISLGGRWEGEGDETSLADL